jgi:hypothetical protein
MLLGGWVLRSIAAAGYVCEVVVEAGKRGVCGRSWLCDERVSGEWAHCGKEKVQQLKSAATERATGCLVVCRFTLTYFVG